MQLISKQPAFELGRIVATPGALAALKRQDNSRASSSHPMLTASGAMCPTRTARKTNTALSTDSGS